MSAVRFYLPEGDPMFACVKKINFSIYLGWILALSAVVVSFQNCAPKEFTMDSASITPLAVDDFKLKDQVVRTATNTPISWTAAWLGNREGYHYSFSKNSIESIKTLPGIGVVELTDSNTWALRYSPEFGFRGETKVPVFALGANNAIREAEVTLQVGNAVNLLSPALAVRASGCITCHAEVHSAFITDFGHGGDGIGRNYYFGQMTSSDLKWNDGLPYGDHYAFYQNTEGTTFQGAWWSINMPKTAAGEGQKVYVPAAAIPTGPSEKTGETSLRGYVQHRLNHSFYADSAAATVIEKNSIYIGAPTALKLKTAFNWSEPDEVRKYKYVPDENGSPLSGLNVTATGPANGKFFTNTDILTCEGDLLLNGTVFFENLVVKTRKGCRIYATGSVFIYGSITYPLINPEYSQRNLQISSSKAILMGFGSLFNGSTHCEEGDTSSAYFTYWSQREAWTEGLSPAEKAAYEAAVVDSAKYRLEYFWGLSGFFFRADTRDGKVIQNEIYSEMLSTIGPQKDAACRPEGRAQAFDRLLLNAPLIESRYAGGFKGSIIAEIAYMGLGLASNQSRFKFEFDSVFQNVDIFPLLKESDFLQVQ